MQLAVANAALAAVVLWLNVPVADWLAASGLQRATDMGILVVAGVGAYFVALARWACGFASSARGKPLQDFYHTPAWGIIARFLKSVSPLGPVRQKASWQVRFAVHASDSSLTNLKRLSGQAGSPLAGGSSHHQQLRWRAPGP